MDGSGVVRSRQASLEGLASADGGRERPDKYIAGTMSADELYRKRGKLDGWLKALNPDNAITTSRHHNRRKSL